MTTGNWQERIRATDILNEVKDLGDAQPYLS